MKEPIELVVADRPDGDVARTKLFAYFGGRRYEQIMCDCSVAMPCSQGHIGMRERCCIWKDVEDERQEKIKERERLVRFANSFDPPIV